MKLVLWLEILTMVGYYSLMAIGFNQAILGHWGWAVLAVVTLLLITLSGFAPIPGRFGEIPATLVLTRRLIWQLAPSKFKEQYFIRLAIYFIACDYRKFILDTLDQHNISETLLTQALMDYFTGRMHFFHKDWQEIAKQTFITYGEVDRIQVTKVQNQFDKYTEIGLIPHLHQSLQDNNLNLIIENYLFYTFINQN
jgi:hypothetical protein